MKVCLLMIATGKYIQFFDKVYKSFEKNFLPEHEKTYFLFTDSEKELPDNVVRIKKKYGGFPKDTLYRFHYFLVLKDIIKKRGIDVMYYSDVDMEAVALMGNEILPKKGGLVATFHPGFYKTGTHSFETSSKSTACLTKQELSDYKYVCGGFQGGYVEPYFKAMSAITKNIDTDSQNGVMAKWHDESHWNKYVNTHKGQFKFLTPEYCYPECKYKNPSYQNYNTIVGLKPRLLALDKNHAKFRK